VSENITLATLDCKYNSNLSTLTFGANTALATLYISDCNLTGVDLSQIITSKDYQPSGPISGKTGFYNFSYWRNPGSGGYFTFVLGYDFGGNYSNLPGLFPKKGDSLFTWTYTDPSTSASSTVTVAYTSK
jgi:hypothetical protein